MPTTRRSNGPSRNQTPAKMPQTPEKAPSSQLRAAPPTHSPYLPTPAELLFLAVYPLILLLGTLLANFSPLLHPSRNGSVYSEVDQSYQPPSAAPSYFARKSNFLNVYFVKIGWLWCTAAILVFTTFVSRGHLVGIPDIIAAPDASASSSTSNSRAQKEPDRRLRRQFQVALRYGLATLIWIITTQWFFGPPLVDRGFALSGGMCDVASARLEELQMLQKAGADDLIAREKEELAKVVTHAACKVAGGAWKGGWDISGHVFILVLGSGMLCMEMLPFLNSGIQGLGLGRVVRTSDVGDSSVGHEIARLNLTSSTDVLGGATSGSRAVRFYAASFATGVAAVSCWMLLMTATFFHTWFEKLTGLLWALLGLWTIYFLPRGQSSFRTIVGMPGF